LHNKNIPKVEKLSYLVGFLAGEALNTIDGYSLTNENYDAIIDVLKQKYGNDRALSSKLTKELLQLPPASDNTASLRKFGESADRICRLMSGLNVENDSPLVYTTIRMKLPSRIRDRLSEMELNSGKKWNGSDVRKGLLKLVEVSKMSDWDSSKPTTSKSTPASSNKDHQQRSRTDSNPNQDADADSNDDSSSDTSNEAKPSSNHSDEANSNVDPSSSASSSSSSDD